MPRYEYRCKDCGEHLEVQQSFRDDPLTVCPTCSGTLKKVFQPVGIAFKGNGFYKNDARSGSSTSSTSSAGASSGSSSNGSSNGSDGGSSGSGSSSSDSSKSTPSTSSSGSGSSSSGSEAKSA
jgi:putative FmdB family regulatory protein